MPDRPTPALCTKSYNPYSYCPLLFKHLDDFISAMVTTVWSETKRLNGLEATISSAEAEMIDRNTGELTAYMNGRIHEILRQFKKEE